MQIVVRHLLVSKVKAPHECDALNKTSRKTGITYALHPVAFQALSVCADDHVSHLSHNDYGHENALPYEYVSFRHAYA